MLGRKLDTIGRRGRRDLARGRVEAQRGLSQLRIEALIAQKHGGRLDRAATGDAAAVPPQAANLEQVGEVAVEQHGQAQIDRMVAMVADRQSLIGRVAPEKDRPHHVQGVLRQHEVIVEIHIRIGQIHGQQRVVVAHVRAQQQGLHPVDEELEMGEETRVAMKQAVGPAGGSADIAVAVEHDEVSSCLSVRRGRVAGPVAGI